jgi:hypothetical protein
MIPVEEMIHFREKHPLHKVDGYSPLTAGAEIIDVSEAINTSRWSHFNRGMQPGLHIELSEDEGVADDAEMDRIYAKLRARFEGVDKHGLPIVTRNGGKVTKISFSPEEMGYFQSAEQMQAFVLSMLRVPKELTGTQPIGTDLSWYAPLRFFCRFVISPRLKSLGSMLSRRVGVLYDPPLRIWHEDPTPDDPKQVNEDINTDFRAGAVTPNEIRSRRGLTPFEDWGDRPLIPSSLQPAVFPGDTPPPQPAGALPGSNGRVALPGSNGVPGGRVAANGATAGTAGAGSGNGRLAASLIDSVLLKTADASGHEHKPAGPGGGQFTSDGGGGGQEDDEEEQDTPEPEEEEEEEEEETDDSAADWQAYDEEHAAWEKETDEIQAAYDKEKAEYDREYVRWEEDTERLRARYADDYDAWQEAYAVVDARFKADVAAWNERDEDRARRVGLIKDERLRSWHKDEQTAQDAKAPFDTSNPQSNTEERERYLAEAKAYAESEPNAFTSVFGSTGLVGDRLRAIGATDEDLVKLDSITARAPEAIAKANVRWLAAVEKHNAALEKWEKADKAEQQLLAEEPDTEEEDAHEAWQARYDAAYERNQEEEERTYAVEEKVNTALEKCETVWGSFQEKAEAFSDDLIERLDKRIENEEQDDTEPEKDDGERYDFPAEPDEPDYPDEPEQPDEPEYPDEPDAPGFERPGGKKSVRRPRRKTADASGHEHKPAGEGGGQFTSGGGGGGSTTVADKPAAGKKPGKLGPSKAKVEIGRRESVERAAKEVFGKDVRLDDVPFASLVGAPDDATVNVVAADPESLRVTFRGNGYTAQRVLKRTDAGELVCENEYIKINASGTGLGTQIFARQVEQCAENGFAFIRCHASRAENDDPNAFNGYYTWPRLGYDQTLDSLEVENGAGLMREVREKFPKAKSVLDIMETQEGRDFWKEKGVDLLDARFDLREGHRSRQVLEAYLAKRGSAAKSEKHWKKSRVAMNSPAEEEQREEIDLTPEEEALLDEAWQEREASNGSED